jgi:hypothetical protein
MDPAIFQTNFNSLMHAAIDGNIAFVPARNKLTGRDVMLLCFVNTEQRPPLIIGGQGSIVEKHVPVCEFTMSDAMHVYEPIMDEPGSPVPQESANDNVVPLRRPGPIMDTPPAGLNGNVVEEPNGPSAA